MFRRNSPTQPTSEVEPDAVDATSTEATQPKGRPTPKRRDAEAARRNKAAPPKDRKEAKQRMRDERTKERERVKEALKSGDERQYPARDRGAGRGLARNWVDGRRNVGEFFWPLVITALVFLIVPVPALQATSTILLLGFYFVVMGDTGWSLLGLRQALNKHVSDPEQRRGVMAYAFGRSIQSRKRRMPRPQVDRGWTKQLRRGEVTFKG